MTHHERSAYTGTTKKLLVAVDIGTTFTAVSFSILQPREVPQFNEILRWPKQATPDAKVPSVVYYDAQGRPQAFGAETEDDEVVNSAETEGWRKAEWWKLHLRPTHLSIIQDLDLPPLPAGISVDKIFINYLGYVKDQLKNYITGQYGEGASIWDALYPSMDVVLTAPNGWEINQQQRMRTAAQQSTLIKGAQSGKRVRFVSEAEAAILYAIESGCIGEWLVNGVQLILCDCGGGTIDIASYKVTGLGPLRLEETTAAGCYLAGAVYVTEAFKKYLQEHLRGTEWGNEEAITRAVQHFEKNAKRKYESADSTSWIDLGGFKNIPALGIVRGKLKIPGDIVASFFSRSLTRVKEGLEQAWRASNFQAKKVILVGGLASSPYMYQELQSWGARMGISVSRPDGPTTKAVANGALAWYLDNSVSARINKYHYGTEISTPWISSDPEINSRPRITDASGELVVTGAWSSIVAQDLRISSGDEYKQPYVVSIPANRSNLTQPCDLWVYRWDQPSRFMMLPGGNQPYPGFELLCRVEANLRGPYQAAPLRTGLGGRTYRDVHFHICLAFGDTELTARLSWTENGQTKYSKATIASRNLAPDARQ